MKHKAIKAKPFPITRRAIKAKPCPIKRRGFISLTPGHIN